jgi:hypothetical protein
MHDKKTYRASQNTVPQTGCMKRTRVVPSSKTSPSASVSLRRHQREQESWKTGGALCPNRIDSTMRQIPSGIAVLVSPEVGFFP